MLKLILIGCAWGVLARSLNNGRVGLSRLEAYTFWAILAGLTVLVIQQMDWGVK